ncbi:MAG TPA: HNH endonuclease signature motif containing protein [Pyrinomonadaceae bacterium]|nr:HNH endonuclease signature motif containing protein [Pyrinomonadaceae bacterium]
MARWISAELRETVSSRAKQSCEYCLIAEADTFYGCEVDHIISLKHGGATEPDNLAYACVFCNRAKGSDVGSIATSGEFTRFFNPRTDRWSEHFRLEGPTIQPLTTIGEVTARIFQFNDSARIHERDESIRFTRPSN